jgi:predicted choloylglycine hydrolase
MEYLLQAYPLYQIHNPEIWEILKKVEEDYEND